MFRNVNCIFARLICSLALKGTLQELLVDQFSVIGPHDVSLLKCTVYQRVRTGLATDTGIFCLRIYGPVTKVHRHIYICMPTSRASSA